jgi:hypothetical protein
MFLEALQLTKPELLEPMQICNALEGLLSFDDIGNTVGLQIASGRGIEPISNIIVQTFLVIISAWIIINWKVMISWPTLPGLCLSMVCFLFAVQQIGKTRLSTRSSIYPIKLQLLSNFKNKSSSFCPQGTLCPNPATGEVLCQHEDNTILNFPTALMAAACGCHLERIFVLLHHDPTIMKRFENSL